VDVTLVENFVKFVSFVGNQKKYADLFRFKYFFALLPNIKKV